MTEIILIENDEMKSLSLGEIKKAFPINNEDAYKNLVELYVYPKRDKIALTYADGETVIYKNYFAVWGFPTVIR